MKAWLHKLYLRFFRPYKRLDVQLVSYGDADTLMKLDSRWEIFKELEDHNEITGMVWIEKREYITE